MAAVQQETRPGYHVIVREGRRIVARESFDFGTFQQIGWWLDEQGLNRPGYVASINFVDDPADDPPAEPRQYQADVTGWNADGESVSWRGHGPTEDSAIDDAIREGGIVEVGDADVRVVA